MAVKAVGPADGKLGFLGTIGVRFMVWGAEAGGQFSLIEHPMSPRVLAAPLHRHSREDEYSCVLRGRLGALLGDDVVYAQPGDLVFKPRNQWHTFWNASDEPASILEIISPGGFEKFFEELSDMGGVTKHPIAAGRFVLTLRTGDETRERAGVGPALRPSFPRRACETRRERFSRMKV
jgi:quercetin dioxygenase-like cupin family protein